MVSRSQIFVLAVGITFLMFLFVRLVQAVSPSIYGLTEGDIISASDSDDPDIYIVKEHGYKRLFLNPIVFGFYGHLKWSNVRNISAATRDAFTTSGLFRNCEANDPNVYGVEVTAEDGGTLHWVNVSGAQAVAEDANFFKKIFCINSNEFNWYPKSQDYTSLSQVPRYERAATETTPSTTITFTSRTTDTGTRLTDGSIPYVLKLADGRFRMYYCGMGGILSVISSDGLNFTKETGVRMNPSSGNESVVCDPTAVILSDGRIRLYYKGGTSGAGPGQAIHKIYAAISTDGLTFTKEGLVIDSEQTGDNGFASVPAAIRLLDGRTRLYYVSDGFLWGTG